MDENKKENKLEVIEEVVVKDITFSTDTIDKKSQAYKQSNTYAAKKTVAQGMMDVALITANANQLRYLIEYQRESPTFYLIMSLIIISLFLQELEEDIPVFEVLLEVVVFAVAIVVVH